MLSEANAVYLVTAYGVFVGAMLVYALVLALRTNNIRRDQRTLDEFETQQNQRRK